MRFDIEPQVPLPGATREITLAMGDIEVTLPVLGLWPNTLRRNLAWLTIDQAHLLLLDLIDETDEPEAKERFANWWLENNVSARSIVEVVSALCLEYTGSPLSERERLLASSPVTEPAGTVESVENTESPSMNGSLVATGAKSSTASTKPATRTPSTGSKPPS